jgi:hypothetical protein
MVQRRRGIWSCDGAVGVEGEESTREYCTERLASQPEKRKEKDNAETRSALR